MRTSIWGATIAGGAASLPSLDELDPTKTIDEGVDMAGRLQFRPLLTIGGGVKTWAEGYHVVALALTEACCHFGVGKVRLVFPFPTSTLQGPSAMDPIPNRCTPSR